MPKSKKRTWGDTAIRALPLPPAGETCLDKQYRLVTGKNGLSVRVCTFASGARAASVAIKDVNGCRFRAMSPGNAE